MSTKTKQAHTPEPWIVTPYAFDDDSSWFYEYTITNSDGDFICHTSGTSLWGGHTENEQANARLIAAAPELLAVCREAEYSARIAAIHEKPDGDLCPWYERLKAAIAKATN